MDATVMREMTDAEVFGSPVRVPQTGAPRVPRGIRNNNPGNIEDGPFARSQPGYKGSDGRFAIYETPEAGTAAKTALLGSYGRKGINTVEGVVNRWAPPSENDSGSYAQFVSQKLGVDPRAPLDMNDPRVLSGLSSAIAQRENGVAAPSSMPGVEMSEAEVFGKPKPPPLPGQPGAVPIPQMGPGVTMERVAPPTDRGMKAEGLGLLKGVTASVLNASGHLERAVTGTPMGNAMAQQGAGLRKMLPQGLTSFIDSPEAFFAEQARKGTLPGKVGEFAGNVLGTAFVPGGPVTSSALSGALLSEKDNLLGVAGDAALAGVAGGVVGKGLDMAKAAGTKAFANIPQIMALPALKKAKRELYKQVETAGHVFDTPSMKKLAKDFADSVREDGGPKAAQLIPFADGFAARLTALSKSKGGVTLSKLDKLRSQIYDDLIERGGTEAKKGYELRKMIDDLMDASSAPFVKEARIANTKFEKVSEVARRMQSAKLAAGRANSGENVVNATRQKLSPMIDPLHKGNVKNLTTDEAALTERIVAGDARSNTLRRASNLARNKFVSGPLGIISGSALGPWTGLGVMAGIEGTGQALRAGAEKYTKGQIDTLVKMMSVGGTKQAVKTAQRIADLQKLGRRTAAGVTASVAPSLAAFQRPEANRKDEKSPNSRTRP